MAEGLQTPLMPRGRRRREREREQASREREREREKKLRPRQGGGHPRCLHPGGPRHQWGMGLCQPHAKQSKTAEATAGRRWKWEQTKIQSKCEQGKHSLRDRILWQRSQRSACHNHCHKMEDFPGPTDHAGAGGSR